MNEYGRMAQQHWMRWLPEQYRQIEQPDQYFTTLGEQVANRIAALTMELAGDDPAGEDFLGKLGRLNNAKQRAREMVLTEMVLLEPEPGSDADPDSNERQEQGQEPEQEQERDPMADWVPLREDPNHPWWRQAMAEETTRLG